MSNLSAFLALHDITGCKDKKHTHTTVAGKRSYLIPDEKLEQFYDVYERALAIKSNVSALSLTEKHREVGPVLIDVDLRFPAEKDPVRAYNANHIEEIVKVYMKCISEFAVDRVDGACAYVMEKPVPRIDKNFVKDGFHIILPTVVTPPEFQFMVREKVMPLLGPIVVDIGAVNRVDDVFDEAVIQRNNWLMVGSGKGDGSGVFEVTHILKYIAADDCLEEQCLQDDDAAYVRLLSIRNKASEPTLLKDWVRPECKSIQIAVQPTEVAEVADAGLIESLLSLLSKTRWDNYEDWTDLAIILINEGHGTDVFLPLWIKFSRISSKFDGAEECKKKWDNLARSRSGGLKLSLGTLRMWAKQDDPEGYELLFVPREILDNYLKSDFGLARIVKYTMGDQLKLTGEPNKMTFFMYNDNTGLWGEYNEKCVVMCVSAALQAQLERVVRMYDTQLNAAMSASADPDVQKELQSKMKEAIDVRNRVRSRAGAVNPLAMAHGLLSESNFVLKLDQHKHLLGVRNGVVDLRTGELRKRRMDDYVYRVVDVDYDPRADTSVVEKFVLSSMADDVEMATYLQKIMGYGITGEVMEQVFVVMYGDGRNGKGLLMQTLDVLLGSLYQQVDAGLITRQKTNHLNLPAERGKLAGARIAVVQELNGDEDLDVADMQALTGGDRIMARPLYCNPVSINPTHLMVLCTNYLPKLPAEVKVAQIKRIICIPWSISFVLGPDEPETQYRKRVDMDLKSRLIENLEGVLAWLVQGARMWYAAKDIKTNMPERVQECTNEYFRDYDYFTEFMSLCMTSGGPKDRVPTRQVLTLYNIWVTDEGSGPELDDRRLASLMKSRGFKKAKGVVGGYANTVQCFFGVTLSSAGQEMLRRGADF